MFLVETADHWSSSLHSAARVWDEDLSELVVEVRPMGRIAGRVLAADGSPAPDAEVALREISVLSRHREGPRPRRPRPVRTDAHGRFELLVDAPGSFHAVADVGGQETLQDTVRSTSGGTTEATLYVPGRYAIRGQLVPRLADDEGDPPRFLISPITVTYWVTAYRCRELIPAAPVRVRVDDSAPLPHVELPMIPGLTLSGAVTWDDGRPAAGVSVHASGRWPEELVPDIVMAVGDIGLRQSDITDAEGRFTLDRIHPEVEYRVRTSRAPGALDEVALQDIRGGRQDLELVLKHGSGGDGPGASAVALRLGPGDADAPVPAFLADREPAELRGQVIDAETGAAIPRFETAWQEWRNARVDLFPGNTPAFVGPLIPGTWHDAPDGRFEIPDLLERTPYIVQVRAAGYATRVLGPWQLRAGDDERVIELHRTGAALVRVVDIVGLPIEGIELWLNPQSDVPLDLHTERPTPLEQGPGVFHYPALPPGTYSAIITGGVSPGQRDSQRFVVTSGETTEVTLSVDPRD